jgi:hypothetical protein
VQNLGGDEVGGVRLLSRLEITEGNMLAVLLDVGLPSPGGLVKTGTAQSAGSKNAIRAIFPVAGFSEVHPAVIDRVVIDVVDFLDGPSSSHVEEGQSMSVIPLAVNPDHAYLLRTAAGEGDGAGLPVHSPFPAWHNPPKFAEIGVIPEVAAQFTGSQHNKRYYGPRTKGKR